MRRPRKKMTKSEACKLLIIGIIMGTVFIFGEGYFKKTIELAEAIQVNATYLTHKESLNHSEFN